MVNSRQGVGNGVGGISPKAIIGAICLVIASGGTVSLSSINREQVSQMIAAEAPYAKDKKMIETKFDQVTQAIRELKAEIRGLRDKLSIVRGPTGAYRGGS